MVECVDASTLNESSPNSRRTKPMKRRLRSRPTGVPASITHVRIGGLEVLGRIHADLRFAVQAFGRHDGQNERRLDIF